MSTTTDTEPKAIAHRRRWTREEKRRIVAESNCEGVNVAEVARKYGIARNLLYRWRNTLDVAGPTIDDMEEVQRLRSRVETLESQMQHQGKQLQSLLSSILTAQLTC